MNLQESLPALGWREWVALPGLGIGMVLAKIDTGARSCALHVDGQHVFFEDGVEQVAFTLRPSEGADVVACRAPVIDRRLVTDSGGHRSLRVFLRTRLELAGVCRDIDINLADRCGMRFPMLLGRTALAGMCLVNPLASFIHRRQARETMPAPGTNPQGPR